MLRIVLQVRHGLPDFPACRTVRAVDEPQTRPWPEALTAVIGRRVAHFRKQRKLSAQQLSDALRDRLGVDMKRSVLGDLENGVRKTVSVSEVFAIAFVLEVPPLLLVAPVGDKQTPDVEVLPRISVDPWSVVRWAAGEGFHGQLDDAAPDYEALVDLLRLYRRHDRLLDEWDDAQRLVHSVPLLPDVIQEPERRGLTQLRTITDDLTALRRLIRQHGAQPPPLPVQLQYLDDRKGAHDA